MVVYQGDSGCGGTTISSGYFVVLGNGDGTFQTPVFQAQGTALYALALDSFHGKNQPLDLVVTDLGYRSTNSSVSILKGNGDGTFASAVVVKDTGFLPVVDVLTDDFNQDGNADLTLVFETESSTSAGASLYSGNGDGTFTEQEVLGIGTISANAIYADVNGDGIPDFIGNSSTGLLSVYLGTGQGNFGAPLQYFFDSVSEPLFAGRFLGDNAVSIVGTTDYSGSTAFFMNQGGTAFTVHPSTTSVISGESITINAGSHRHSQRPTRSHRYDRLLRWLNAARQRSNRHSARRHPTLRSVPIRSRQSTPETPTSTPTLPPQSQSPLRARRLLPTSPSPPAALLSTSAKAALEP